MKTVQINDGGQVSGRGLSSDRKIRSIPAAQKRSRQLQVLSIAAAGCLAAFARHSIAANDLWIGSTDANLGTAANWTAGTLPATNDSLEFGLAGSTGSILTDNLLTPATYNLSGMTFDYGASAYNISAGTPGTSGFTLTGSIIDKSPSNPQIISDPITVNASQNVNIAAGGSVTIGGVLSGAGGLTEYGPGVLTLNQSNTYTGTIAANTGTVQLDFTAAGAPASNISAGTSRLSLGGGTLLINGNATTANSQAFAGTTFGTGANTIAINSNGNATAPTLALGALTNGAYSPVLFPTTGTVTTTTNEGGPKGIMWSNYATYGTSDWASTDNAAGTAFGNTIVGLSSVAGGYVTTMGGTGQNQNLDLTSNYTANGNVGTTTIRFNTPTATTANVNGKWIVANAVLVTPNMGANNATIGNGNWYAVYNTAAATEWVTQNNTQGFFIIGGLINDKGGGGALTYVQSGPGTVQMPWTSTASGAAINSANQYTGSSYLLGGSTLIKVDADLGSPAAGASAIIDGGSIVGDANFTLDNSGAKARPITVGSAGGGLAAIANTTMTIDGQVGSTATGGMLTIGIPASTANGGVVGLVAGTGAGTANTTALYGTGTVSLTYANGANGNFQYGGTTILGGATLEINSQYDLGGSVAGALTFNNGTLQYNPTLASGAAGSAVDISAQPVIFAGNGTIDTYGHNITYANPIGAGGTGGLTVVDSAAVASRGSLTLSGTNAITGTTVVNSGTLALASGASLATSSITVNSSGTFLPKGISSAPTALVTLNSGGTLSLVDPAASSASGVFTTAGLTTNTGSLISYVLSGTSSSDQITVSGSGGLNISGGQLKLYAVGGILPFSGDGTFNLINYTSPDTVAGGGTLLQNTTALNTDLTIANKVSGLSYTFNDTGSVIQLVISGTPVTTGGWSFDGNGSWKVGTNWTSSPTYPNTAGSTASFGGAAATDLNLSRTVTLDQNETVGTVIFASPNGESYNISQGTSGTLILDNAGSGTGITVSSGTHAINAPVALNSALDINLATGSSLSIGGAIANGTSTQTLTKDGPGTLALSGANTYGPAAGAVGTTINAGLVQIGNNAAFSTGDVSLTASLTIQSIAPTLSVTNNFLVGSGYTMTVDTQANSVTLSGVVSGSSSALTMVGSGTLVLSNTDTYSGTTTISAGTVQLGGGAVGGSVAGNIVDNAALTLSRSDDYSLGNLISGSGKLTQNGPDNVTLTNSNTYTGYTAVAGGTLTLGNNLAIQDSTLNYNNQGGTFSFGTLTAATFAGLTGSQSLALSNTAAAAVALTIQGGPNTYTGFLGGTGSLTMNSFGNTATIGSGTAGGANYSGGTTVNAGTLVLGGVGNISTGTIDVSGVNGPSNLVVADSAQVTSTGTLYLADAGGNNYPGVCTLIVKGNSQLTVGGLSFGNYTRVPSSTVTVQDTATLTVNGPLNLEQTEGTTASNNTVNLNGGTLATQNIIFVGGGTGGGTTQVANIQFNGGVLKALASDPAGSTFLPKFTGVPANVDAGGAIVNTNGFNDTIATPLLHNTGAAVDGGLTKTGAGVLTLTVASTYNGPTVISGGTLRLAAPGALVAAYSFDNTTATPVGSPSTITNNGNGGTAMNGTVNAVSSGINIVSGGPTINGVSGNALQFTGDGSAVVIPSGITDLSSGGSWTVSSWIQTNESGATILSKNTGLNWAANNSIFYLSNGTGGTAAATAASPAAGTIPTAGRNGGGFLTGAATANVTDNTWHMVTYVDNAGTKSIYIDGVLSALSQTGLTTADAGTQVLLGYSPDTSAADGTYQLLGNLDDINFFNTALTAAQINNLKATNSAFGPGPNVGVNTLSTNTAININTSGGSLDVNGTYQTVASLTGVAGTSVTLGGGQLTVGNAANTAFAGSITDTGSASTFTGGSLVKQGAGTLTLSGSNSYSGGTSVTAGTLQLASPNAFPTNTSLAVSSGAFVTIANHSGGATYVPVLSSLSNSGTIDLVNNALVVHSGALATITAEAQAAYNNGAWNGTNASAGVITSSLASADPTHLTAVGVATGLSGTFEGVSVTSSDVLVKYTYYGDANLDGVVDGTDYSRIDSTYLSEKTTSTNISGWYNGDFNYDGVVDGSDYTLMDNAYNSQSGQIAAEIASPTSEISGAAGTSSVPEPASLTLLGIGAAGLLGRRRRR